MVVDMYYADEGLRRICADQRAMRRKFGAERAKRLQVRLTQLQAAERFGDLSLMTARVHMLSGDRKGQLALDLDGPYRLIVRPLDESFQPFDGDPTEARVALIEEIADYH